MAPQDLADGAALGQVDDLFRGRGRTPFGKPRYGVVVMIEGGTSGGGTCAPAAKRIYSAILDAERATSGGTQTLATAH